MFPQLRIAKSQVRPANLECSVFECLGLHGNFVFHGLAFTAGSGAGRRAASTQMNATTAKTAAV